MSGPPIPVAHDPVAVHIGLRVRALRQSQRLSQRVLGEAVGVSLQQIQKYEKGINRVSGAMLYGLAHRLRVPVSAFFEGLPDPVGERAPILDPEADA